MEDIATKTYSLTFCMMMKNMRVPNPSKLNANIGISATRDSAY